jgi:hypothetical protein
MHAAFMSGKQLHCSDSENAVIEIKLRIPFIESSEPAKALRLFLSLHGAWMRRATICGTPP